MWGQGAFQPHLRDWFAAVSRKPPGLTFRCSVLKCLVNTKVLPKGLP
jgi:hypothetical protein